MREQTIFITSSSETCRNNCISCLLNEFFIDIASKMIPAVPSCSRNSKYSYAMNFEILYPFGGYVQDHYLFDAKYELKIRKWIFWRSSLYFTTHTFDRYGIVKEKTSSFYFWDLLMRKHACDNKFGEKRECACSGLRYVRCQHVHRCVCFFLTALLWSKKKKL